MILQSDFSKRFLYVFSRCDLESVAHDNGVLRECDSMRCGRRSIKSKNRDKKREGNAERERESCSNVFGVRCSYNAVRRVRLNALRSQIDNKTFVSLNQHLTIVSYVVLLRFCVSACYKDNVPNTFLTLVVNMYLKYLLWHLQGLKNIFCVSKF